MTDTLASALARTDEPEARNAVTMPYGLAPDNLIATWPQDGES